MDLTSYQLLGNSGLIVSPLALSTMVFAEHRWCGGEENARALFNAYLDAGGNFINTADYYAAGASEAMLGRFAAESKARERLVIATKSGAPRGQGLPVSKHLCAKNIRAGIDASLKRLQTDYIDMYWMHLWDSTTPVEKVLQALVRAMDDGKILYYGFSNAPAWYVAELVMLAQAHGLPKPVGLQYAYSLLDRGVEQDLIPMGFQYGLGMVASSPLAAGMLSAKYGREALSHRQREVGLSYSAGGVVESASDGRLKHDSWLGSMFLTHRNFDIVDVLESVASDIGRSPAEVALAWVASRPGVSSVLLGASQVDQLQHNIGALDLVLQEEQLQRLAQATSLANLNPYSMFGVPTQMHPTEQRVAEDRPSGLPIETKGSVITMDFESPAVSRLALGSGQVDAEAA